VRHESSGMVVVDRRHTLGRADAPLHGGALNLSKNIEKWDKEILG
jgi:hypothetical protein